MDDETVRERKIDVDEGLLRRFLSGALEDADLIALEERLDTDPDLRKKLAKLARRAPTTSLEQPLTNRGTQRLPTTAETRKPRRSFERSLEIGAPIGEGGMGIVYYGTQHSVGRPVAIKTVKSSKAPTGNLLEEAFITGQLEHPNIVPIHDIQVGEDGRPLVVLKKIEGMAWSELVKNPQLIAEKYGVWDTVEWHVGVLVQVCQALRFAHSRHIIHRDIKPENVMIGTFDEVYLLDWGLAISTAEDDTRLPTLRTSHGIAGTPAYMAPEQFDRVPDRVGPHTDVYLVGAALYEAVVGQPPQIGETLREIRENIVSRSEVFMPEGTPLEIVAIINRAMAPSVADRYPDIQALREDLERFLRNRGSQDLVDRADERASIMEAAQDRKDEEVAERAFIEAAFGYRMALDTWSGNHSARERLGALVDNRVRKLLTMQAPMAARRALALIDAPEVELVERVDRALLRDTEVRERITQLERDEDRTVGVGVRRVLVAILGTIWIVLWSALGWSQPETATPLLLGTLFFWVLGTVLVLRVRSEMLAVRQNRIISWLCFITFTGQLLWLGAAMVHELPMPVVMSTLMLFWALGIASGAIAMEHRLLPSAILYGLGFLLCSYVPEALPWMYSLGAVGMVANMAAINIAIARSMRAAADQAAPPSSMG